MGLALLVFIIVLFHISLALQIEVYNGSNLIRTYNDKNAAFEGRTSSIMFTYQGTLMYPVPRNACSTVTAPPSSDHYIAFVPEYDDCPGDNDYYLDKAKYKMMVTMSSSSQTLDDGTNVIIVVVFEDFGKYLETLLDDENKSNNSANTIFLKVSENSFWFYERIILIFCFVLMIAITLAICVFCCTCICRWVWQKWQRRGLTQWRVRQLPRRRYRSSKEKTETCSICLEDFKEGENIRVLPCEHVFHPVCVDEWLQKWNRTCPLCKVEISRRGRRTTEQVSLLSDAENRQGYGTTGSGTTSNVSMETPNMTSDAVTPNITSNSVTPSVTSSENTSDET